MTQQTTPEFAIGSKVNILNEDDPMMVRVGGGACGELVNITDGKHEWTIKAIEAHEGKRCYRAETRTLSTWVSLNQIMNGPCPRAEDYITHTRRIAVDPSERD